MEEAEIYEGLGLEVPEEPAAVDGAETSPSGEGDAEIQDSGDGGPEGEAVAEQPNVEATEETPAEPPQEPPHTDLEAARRAAEDEAYRTAYAGKLNPYTQKPINSKADFEQYQAQLQAERQRARMEQMRKAGIDPDAIQEMIDRHPAIQQAQAVMQAAEAERERARTEQAKGWYGEQLKEINALDPEAKLGSLDDLAARDPAQYGKLLGMVSGGLSLVDAYKALNFDTLTQKRAAAAQQAVRNQAAGKAHLAPVGGQSVGGVEVPREVRQMYRDLNPGMTDAQIRFAYAEYVKETGQG